METGKVIANVRGVSFLSKENVLKVIVNILEFIELYTLGSELYGMLIIPQ